ncbi:uncharacterized protein FFB20_13997 [Fusarium fujikuroi]|nr:uncharacterized protein FFE2_03029 [Fusarium fujikuroi]SCN92002.1 uncharacterized protein FFC1_06633 [Fusarium fujikuroi]SCN96038.1 uncharacterized protein FFC1_07469 [Fusarium fujikuroi]SCO07933.1 uncharacterized protein FFB20_12945 [Fusarium fujikuroi]SCO12415.1 uncharacterized protein FFB20_13997 [Fusarium fujikuroi]
MIYKDCLY